MLEKKHEYLPPAVIEYRNYKSFDYAIFNKNLFEKTKYLNSSILNFPAVKKIFIEISDKPFPFKKKYIRANNSKFVTKESSEAIMLKTKLTNQFLKVKTFKSRMKVESLREVIMKIWI